MRIALITILLMSVTIAFAQSDKDMIIASWKCVGIELPPVTLDKKQNKKRMDVLQTNKPDIDTISARMVGAVYGFRYNSDVAINRNGNYNIYRYKITQNAIIINDGHLEFVYTITDINYRTMTWQDNMGSGLIYKFERQ